MEAEFRKVVAIGICLFLLFLYKQSIWDPYIKQNLPNQSQTQSSPAAAVLGGTQNNNLPAGSAGQNPISGGTGPSAIGSAVAAPASAPGQPSESEVAQAEKLKISTGLFDASLSLLGGRFTELSLTEFAETIEKNSPRLNLIDHVPPAPYPLGIYVGNVSDAAVHYQLISYGGAEASASTPQKTFTVSEGGSAVFVLKGALPDGRSITKTVTFEGGKYLIALSVNLSPAASGMEVPLHLEWIDVVSNESPAMLDPYKRSGFTWYNDQKAERKAYTALKTDIDQPIPAVRWISMADKYFMTTLISAGELAAAEFTKQGVTYRARLAGGSTEGNFQIYVGPKNYQLLMGYGHNLQLNVDLGFFLLHRRPTPLVPPPLLRTTWKLWPCDSCADNYGPLCVIPFKSSLF